MAVPSFLWMCIPRGRYAVCPRLLASRARSFRSREARHVDAQRPDREGARQRERPRNPRAPFVCRSRARSARLSAARPSDTFTRKHELVALAPSLILFRPFVFWAAAGAAAAATFFLPWSYAGARARAAGCAKMQSGGEMLARGERAQVELLLARQLGLCRVFGMGLLKNCQRVT